MMEETQSSLQQDNISTQGEVEENRKVVLTSDVIKEELQREKHKNSHRRVLKSTVGALIAVIAAVTLLVVLVLPVLQISGDSMSGTLNDGDIVLALKKGHQESGDVIAFYYGNDILLKRVIATGGQWVDMDQEGNVYVENELLEEPYVTDKTLGECSIVFPYQVPEGKMFVLGDHRTVSVDSRNGLIGCVDDKSTIGKVIFRVWPLADFGFVN